MMNWVLLSMLVGEIVILTWLDRAAYRTWVTPLVLLAWPYAVVVLLTFFFGPLFGYVPLFMESVLVWVAGLPLFWLGGLPVALLGGGRIRAETRAPSPLVHEEKSKRLALLLAWACILGLMLRFLQVGGPAAIAREDFLVAYVAGWAGHVMTVAFLLLAFLIGVAQRKEWALWLTILVLLGMVILYQTKTWIFMSIVAGLIYRVMSGRLRLSLSKVPWALLTVAILFSLSYLIGFGAGNRETIFDPATYRFLLRHSGSYIFGGVLSWGEAVRLKTTPLHGDALYVYGPFVNLYRVATSGDLVSDVSPYWSLIDRAGTRGSNVHTFFGTLLMYLGWLRTVVHVLGLSLVFHGLFALAQIRRNCWIAAAWSFLAAGLSFGWFDYYYRSLAFLEVTAYGIALGLIVGLASRHPHGSPDRGLCRPLPGGPSIECLGDSRQGGR